MEIERKFLLDGFPNLAPKSESVMFQGYISTMPTVRIRSKTSASGKTTYKLTFKSAGEIVRQETEISITKKVYTELLNLLEAPPIKKIKKTYALEGGLTLECSFVDIEDDSFYYAEVEFPSVEEAEKFVPPSFLGKEITFDNAYKMNNVYARYAAKYAEKRKAKKQPQ